LYKTLNFFEAHSCVYSLRCFTFSIFQRTLLLF